MTSHAPSLPVPQGSLASLREQARDCRNCDLWRNATQTVFGRGPAHARVMLVGEQPGDREDIAGRPFVGPAGKLLDRALAEAGLERKAVYVTNAVKHFKFEPRGKFRLHKRANAEEQRACRPWLMAELDRVKPAIVVCMGAMASSSLLGRTFRLLKERGQWRELEDGTRAIATVHPSYLLRLPDEDARRRGFDAFVADLRVVAEALAERA
ncbi:MAG TPA: UdgX family uracil-DNA binding protein [Nevskiaceae bacterium]|nr:UdgX family uracil-DNA binding protein [Nevskiaceae bacterium]